MRLEEMLTGARIHVVAAHADDETLGCGGLLALADGRSEVHVTVLADGVTSRDIPEPEVASSIADRERRAEEALGLLGIDHITFHRLPDNALDRCSILDVARRIEDDGRASPADIVLLPWLGDLNIDHEIAGRAGLTAYRPLPGSSVSLLLMYEVPSSTGWRTGDPSSTFVPGLSVDISDALDRKLGALRAYGDELPPSPHARSDAGVTALARHRGHSVGVEAAEGFVVARWRL